VIVFFSAKNRYPDEVRNGWYWDILLIRPDGTDEQPWSLAEPNPSDGRSTFVHPSWAPDQSYIVCHGCLGGHTGRTYHGATLIEWRQKKWRQILGTALESREHSDGHDWTISPDSRKVFRHGITYVVRGANEDQETDLGDVFEVYDVPTRAAMEAPLLSPTEGPLLSL